MDTTKGALIDNLRYSERHEEADEIQFGGAGDGHRCNVCGQLAGGDRTHRCWVTPVGFLTSNSMDPDEAKEHEEWIKETARGK